MTPEKPTLVFVPGAWHTPDVFDAVRASLKTSGYPSVALALPCNGAEPPNKTLADDSNLVASEIEKLADEGKKVVVVAHSYGGIVCTNAVEHLDYAERQKKGKAGGVIMLVYMCAFVLKQGTSLLQSIGGHYLPWTHVQVRSWLS